MLKTVNRTVIVFISALFLMQCSHLKLNKNQKTQHRIIPVEEWGGTPYEGEFPAQEIKYVTLHHGGVEFARTEDPEEYLRNLQWWSRTEKGWIDIPYHYLIDLDGNIYAGRDIKYPGDTNTEYNPTGHALICVLGNYEVVQPNRAELDAIVWLMTKLAQDYNLSPDVIASHRDYSDKTVCPGKNLYRYIENGYFRKQVEKRLAKSRPITTNLTN